LNLIDIRTLFLTSLNALMALPGVFAAWCKTSAELRLDNLLVAN
jgi:hypothetical protein